MNLDQFINKWNGQYPLYAPNASREYLRGQCVQLVCFYVTEVLGTPVMWRDAADWWYAGLFPEIYVKVGPNDLRRGDIAIWGGDLPNSGGAGHIAIVVSDNTAGGSFVSFDSNWGGKQAHHVTHNKSYLIGGLRKRGAPPAPQPTPQGGDEMIANTDQATKIYRLLRPNGGASQGEVDATAGRRSFAEFINSAQTEVAARDANLQAQANQLASMSNTINQLNQALTDMKVLEQKEDVAEAQQLAELKANRAKIDILTGDLETAHDKIVELQNTPPTPMSTTPKTNWLTKLLLVLFKPKAK